MSKQTIRISVPIDDDWDAGDRIQIFTDFGDGTIDMTTPLLPRPVAVFPARHRDRGFGSAPVGSRRLGGKSARPGTAVLGNNRLGITPLGTPGRFIDVDVEVDASFGPWKFGAQVVDLEGHPQTGAVQEGTVVVSGTDPPPLTSFAFNSYDSGNDQVVFDFTKDT